MVRTINRIFIVGWITIFMILSGFPLMFDFDIGDVAGDPAPQPFTSPPHVPIRINNDTGFNSTNGVTSGTGVKGDPYMINGWLIYGTNQGYCIYIGNTTKYFCINDTYLWDASGVSGSYYWNSGIIFYNISNGMITNCNSSLHDGRGIYIINSNNCTFDNNRLYMNYHEGVRVEKSKDIIVGNSHLWYNNQGMGFAGLVLKDSEQITVELNTIEHNPVYGAFIDKGKNNHLIDNDIIYNCGGNAGLVLSGTNNNHIFNNNVSNSTGNGIEIHWSNLNLFENNTINDNNQLGAGWAGVYMYYSNNNTWKNNSVYNTFKGNGIQVTTHSHYNTFINNKIGHNDAYGIQFSTLHNCVLRDNEINWNQISGIRLESSNDFEIKNNEFWENNQATSMNYAGIELYQSFRNTIEDNYAHDNPKFAVQLKQSFDNDIINNDILFNCGDEAGLFLDGSYNNRIESNDISNDTGSGIRLQSSTFNYFGNNTVNNNSKSSGDAGIYIETNSHNNTFFNNIINNTINRPGVLITSGSHYNVFIENSIGYNKNNYGIQMYTIHNTRFERNEIYWNYYSGMYLSDCRYNTIHDNEIWENNQFDDSWYGGIELAGSRNNTITDNHVHNNPDNGIIFSSSGSNNNIIEHNDIVFNCGGLAGVNLYYGLNNKIISNNISNNTGMGIQMYASDNLMENNTIIGNQQSGIYSGGNQNSKIIGNTIMYNNKEGYSYYSRGGVYLQNSINGVISGNTISNNYMNGIMLEDAENTTITYNEIINNRIDGIVYYKDNDAMPDFVSIENNTIAEHPGNGTQIFTGYHVIKNNFIADSGRDGLYISSNSNTIVGNSFYNNTYYGVNTSFTTGNVIHHNNFFDNNGTSIQASDNTQNNQWDDGAEGNYWNDYEARYVPPAVIIGKIWNMPYNLTNNITNDSYPLAKAIPTLGINDNTPASGNTGDSFTFSCKIIGNVYVDRVHLYYYFGTNVGSAVNVSMNHMGSNIWTLTISLPPNSVDPLKYYIHAFDIFDTSTSHGLETVTIDDNDEPVAAAGNDIQMEAGSVVSFNDAGSTDNVGIVNRTWSFIYDSLSINLYGANTQFKFDIPGVYDVLYSVKDAANLKNTDSLVVTIVDTTDPSLVEVNFTDYQYIGIQISVRARVYDFVGVRSVGINYTDVLGKLHNASMSKDTGDNWTYNIPGQPTIGMVTFQIWMQDLEDNIAQSQPREVTILDQIPPEIKEVMYPVKVEVGQDINVSVKVTDNIEVLIVKIIYVDVNSVLHNVSMTPGTGDNYTFSIPGQTKEGSITFRISANDTYGNWVLSAEHIIDIVKKPPEIKTKPVIVFITLPAEVKVNTGIEIKVSVIDDSGIDNTYLVYTDVSNETHNVTMTRTRSGIFSYAIPGQTVAGTLKLYVAAVNTLGVWNTTDLKSIIITALPPPFKDTFPPFVVSTDPPNNAVNVSVDTKVTITFNESMDTSSVISALQVLPKTNYTISWDMENKTIVITFDENLTYDKTYLITLGTSAMDPAGNKMKEKFEFKFKTIKELPVVVDPNDRDGDGMNDTWEKEHGFDPDDPDDADLDSDGDGLSNLEEFKNNTDPNKKDTDGDGMPDKFEIDFGLDPRVDDSAEDSDGDGFSNLEEYEAGTEPDNAASVPSTKKEADEGDNMVLYLALIIIVIIALLLVVTMMRKKKVAEEEPAEEGEEEEEEEEEEEGEEEAKEEPAEEGEEGEEEEEVEEEDAEDIEEFEEVEGWEEEEEEEIKKPPKKEKPKEKAKVKDLLDEDLDDEDWEDDLGADEDEEDLDFDLTKDSDEEWDDWDT